MYEHDRSTMGTVYLVGAGPGSPDLITVRGAQLLGRAGVVLHDALVDRRLLDLAHPHAEVVDVGIRAGRQGAGSTRTSRLSRRGARIERLMVDAAAHSPVVVRLKGGDPFVFGRGAEEVLALERARIPWEVVPGVTAGTGVLAAAGIPATRRGVASSVVFITARTEGSDGTGPDWSGAALEGSTVVVYMGGRRIREVARDLIRHGRDPATPAALIEWGTLPRQRVETARLDTLASQVGREAPVEGPAIIVVGEVVRFRDEVAKVSGPCTCAS